MFLLALSSVQPVIMRQVLYFLEKEYRKTDPGNDFNTVLQACIDRSSLSEDHSQSRLMLKELVNTSGNIPESLKLEAIKLDNLRLVKSFSFVGEISHDEVNFEEKSFDLKKSVGRKKDV